MTGTSTLSLQCIGDARLLPNLMLVQDLTLLCLQDPDAVRYLVEFAGYPQLERWEWRSEASLQDEHGKWTCPEAIARFRAMKTMNENR